MTTEWQKLDKALNRYVHERDIYDEMGLPARPALLEDSDDPVVRARAALEALHALSGRILASDFSLFAIHSAVAEIAAETRVAREALREAVPARVSDD